MSLAARFLLALALLVAAVPASAQDDEAILLVAHPQFRDIDYRQAVLLAAPAPNGGHVGVILNRPTPLKLSQFLTDEFQTENYKESIFFGGPVMRQALVSLFRSETAPKAAAFHVLKDVYLTMHPDNIESLLKDAKAHYRIYAGFSGWAPRQLESEVMRDGWYFLQADEATVFRDSADGLWEELLERAQRADPRGRS